MSDTNKKPGALYKALDNVWNIVGVSVGFLCSFSVILIPGRQTPQSEISVVAISFLISFLALMAYLFAHLRIIRHGALREAKLRDERDRAVSELTKNVKSNQTVDGEFKRLSQARGQFDGAVLDALEHFTNQRYVDSAAELVFEKFRRATKDYMIAICDAARKILAARRSVAATAFECNIKLITSAGQVEKYVIAARSPECSPKRAQTDAFEQEHYLVARNAFFHVLLQPFHANRYVIVDDLSSQIDLWRRHFGSGSAFVEPSEAALEFYTKALVVPIVGPAYEIPDGKQPGDGRAMLRFRPDETILGLILVDSKEYPFDDKFDLGIMEELAAYLYYALRSLDCIGALLK